MSAKLEALYLTSGRSPNWCAEELKLPHQAVSIHIHGLDLRMRRYSDSGHNVARFLELCEEELAQGNVPVTSHAYVNALRLQADMAERALKSHPGIMLFISLPKAMQDELTDVMRAAMTSDEALAALASPQEVGAGTVEEAEEPPAEVESKKKYGHRPIPAPIDVGKPAAADLVKPVTTVIEPEKPVKPLPTYIAEGEGEGVDQGCTFGPLDDELPTTEGAQAAKPIDKPSEAT